MAELTSAVKPWTKEEQLQLKRKFRKNFGQKRCKFNKDKMLAQITQNSVAKSILPMMYFILACIAILLYISSQDVYTKDK